MIFSTCRICNKKFESGKLRIYCSNKCKFSDKEYNKSRGRITEKIIEIKTGMKCLECGKQWNDKTNRSGLLTTHIKNFHKMNIFDYIKKYPESKELLGGSSNWRIKELDIFSKEEGKDFIMCKICNKKMHRINNKHLKKHDLTVSEYRKKYGNNLSEYSHKKQSEATIILNKTGKTNCWNTSKEEKLVKENFPSFESKLYLKHKIEGNKIYDFYKNRVIIEYDGIYYHPINFSDYGFTFHQLQNVSNDQIKNQLAIENGYSIYRINDKEVAEQNYQEKSYSYYNCETKENKLFKLQWNNEALILKEYLLEQKEEYLKNIAREILRFIRIHVTTFEEMISIPNDKNIIEELKLSRVSDTNNLISHNNIGIKNIKYEYSNLFRTKNKYVTNLKEIKTTEEIFYDDELFLKVIKYRCGLNKNRETFDITKDTLLQGINSYYRSTPSIFRPHIAYQIYKKYCKENDNVYDPCSGFGARLLGAYANNLFYIGNDVNKETIENSNKFIQKLNYSKIKLYNEKSQDLKLEKDCIDFIFTSLPYFDKEIYSDNNKSNNYEEWKDKFLKKTINNCYECLKKDKKIALNIDEDNKNTILKICNELNLKYIESLYFSSGTSHFNKTSNKKQHEILVFVK